MEQNRKSCMPYIVHVHKTEGTAANYVRIATSGHYIRWPSSYTEYINWAKSRESLRRMNGKAG